jgi:hypothetical protein
MTATIHGLLAATDPEVFSSEAAETALIVATRADNIFMARARALKAVRLADALRRAGAEPVDLMHLTPEAWEQAEKVAGIRTASEDTRTLAHDVLAGRVFILADAR